MAGVRYLIPGFAAFSNYRVRFKHEVAAEVFKIVCPALPLVWFIGSCVVGSLAFLMWAVRARRVEIAPDSVRIWRGLRPFPRTYARPPYGKVVRVDKAVYVGKTGGFAVINASASPMLSAAEAPWVAAEMRRAMRETAR